jgi:hypothetical protein
MYSPTHFFNLGARRGWVVSTTPRPFYLLERPGTHCTGGWVGSRAGLDVCEKSRPHRNFFLYHSWPFLQFWPFWLFWPFLTFLVVRVINMGQIILLPLPKEGMLWIFPAGKIRRLRSGANPRYWVPEASMQTPRPPKPIIQSPDRPTRSHSLYRLSYAAHLSY